MFELCIGLVVGCMAGVIGLLVFQGGEITGRLAQHASDLSKAWAKADEVEARALSLSFKLKNAQDEHETWWAQMALAQDKLVVERDQLKAALVATDSEHAKRMKTWLALEGALYALHADPSPRCLCCGESIGVHDPLCFVCGMEDARSNTAVAQA